MGKHIYATNPVESVNAGIELMRLELGGHFPSRQALEVNLFIQVVNLQDRWWRRPVPTVRAKSYELLQIFAMKYELAEDHETVHNFYGKSPGWSFSTLMDGAREIWGRCGGVRCIAFEVLPPRYVNDPDYWVVNDWDEGYALMDEVLDVPCDWCSPCGDVNYHHLAHELGHALGLCHPKSAHNCREAINSLLRALIYIGKRACTGSQDIRD